jgi:hypothetical protein
MTNSIRRRVLLVIAAVAVGVSGSVLAQPRHAPSAYHGGGGGYYGPHGGVRFGLYLGGPWYGWPGYYYGAPYYSPYYYPPAVVTVPSSPPTYVEQGPAVAPAAPPAPQPGYWYYCADARAYYPYVKECPAGWQRVSPQPPG